MSEIFPTVLDVVGRTPLVHLQRLTTRSDVEILAKLDYLNPGGSTKDRPLVRMVEEAEKEGTLQPGATIIDSSSGNFAIAMAMAGAVKGYPVVCVVDPKLTEVVQRMLLSLGAELVYATEADETGSYLRDRLALRDELVETTPGAWCPDQYTNKASIRAHYYGTGAEIVDAVQGKLDAVVFAVGTGGTISGASRMIKDHLPHVKVIAADAIGSQIFDTTQHPWLQKGLGSGLQAEELDNLDVNVIDEVRLIGDQEAFMTARALARQEGLLAGGSAGCAVFAALTVARDLPSGSRIVVVLPDRLERYLFEHQSDTWMMDHQFHTDTSLHTLHCAVQHWCEAACPVAGPGNVPVYKRPQSFDDATDRTQPLAEALSISTS